MSDTNAASVGLKLTPPEVIQPVVADTISQAGRAVPLSSAMQQKVNDKLEDYVQKLLTGDPSSEDFRAQVDASFALGRKEIAQATELSNRFTKRNSVGMHNEPAYQAISAMRELFEELKPPAHAELFSAKKILGIPIPFGLGSKLQSYLRRYQTAETQIDAMMERMEAMSDDLKKDVHELAENRKQVWGAIEKLEAAAQFMSLLDKRLAQEVESLKATDPMRAKAIEQEVRYYATQNYGDMLAAQALSINAYNVMEVLQKTGRETINGIDRTATLGRSALTIAVTLAQATGAQMKAMKAVSESKATIEGLIASTSVALGEHVDLTTKFAADPIIGVKTLTEMYDNTFKAMDAMDNFRSKAIEVMAQNNAMLADQSKKAMERIEARNGGPEKGKGGSGSFDLNF